LALSWQMFLLIHIFCLCAPFFFAVIHSAFYHRSKAKYRFLWLSSSYFIVINVVLKSLFLGVVRIFWGSFSANFEHFSYSPIFSEYGVLMLSIGIFGFMALFSRSIFRIAPSILFGVFLLLASVTHWFQLEAHIILAKSSHYLLIIFDILTAIVLFYHSWKLKKLGLLDVLVYSESSINL
jgi:hypothetical protein